MPSASSNAYPNAAEQALLVDLRAVPGDFAAMCRRGPYTVVYRYPAYAGMPGPLDVYPAASLDCLPGISTGAGDVVIRRVVTNQFGGSTADYISILLDAHSVHDANGTVTGVGIPPGDCATSPTAEGTWTVPGGGDSGEIVCYVDDQTGDALLVWTYDQQGILVIADNERGDSAALYGFFERVARFIGR